MNNKRKIAMFDELVFYLLQLIRSEDDLRHTLNAIGFTEHEINEIIMEGN